MTILTNCAACAAPLDDDAARCVGCRTCYCSEACLRYHAHRGGHDDEKCAEIDRGGGAEQYHADKQHTKAVAAAVEACADDKKGQTCYICMDGLDPDTNEGLVRGCACRGTAGFAHVSCLARQAKTLVAEAEENNLDDKAFEKKWKRWHACGLCEQDYHGVVKCALGWACWKTYVGQPEVDRLRRPAISMLGSGLFAVGHHEDTLSVYEAELSTMRRLGDSEERMLIVQGNITNVYQLLGRLEQALSLRRDVYMQAI